MFYDRPKKKIKRPPEIVPASDDAGMQPQAVDMHTKRKKRFSLFRFFFLTPVHENRAQSDEEGYADVPEAYRPKRKHYLLRALAVMLVLMIAAGGLMYILPVGVFGSHSKDTYSADNALPKGYVHVLLIGIDVDSEGTSRSDTMMIASVARGDIKLTSLQRDTGVAIPGKSGYHRLNAAYAYGGAELLLKTVNTNFGLNITRYALVDYETFPGLIDKLGGVELTVSEAEIKEINKNLYSLLGSYWHTGKMEKEAAYTLYESSLIDTSKRDSSIQLNGLQALAYSRIRKIDSDYGRTNRQRKVISAAISAVKDKTLNPFVMVPLVSEALSSIETNMNAAEIASLALKALSAGMPEQTRLPIAGTYDDYGSMFENVNYEKNTEYFMQFVYGE